jgi:hypothetical protein
LLENRRQELPDLVFIAGRVGRIDANEVLEELGDGRKIISALSTSKDGEEDKNDGRAHTNPDENFFDVDRER